MNEHGGRGSQGHPATSIRERLLMAAMAILGGAMVATGLVMAAASLMHELGG